MTQTLQIKEVKTAPLTIKIDCPAAKGYFTGQAFIRSKAEIKELLKRAEDGHYEDDDERFLRDLYERFDGLGEGDGFSTVLTSSASAYLIPAATQAYFEHYGEAKRGNFAQRRGR